MTKTQVYFVGAGPGDPKLITQKALECIQKVDVILYDYLVHPSLIMFAKQSVKLECVGKKKGHHSKTQAAINQLIIDYARQGLSVLRLKGGDPSVFGRLGEEMEWCKAHQLSYEVIPGVSSAIAAPVYAGIPVTHREKSRSLAFLTGTLKTGGSMEMDHIPDAETIVVLMSVSHLGEVVKKLLAHGRFNKDTPMAIISHGTMPTQQVIESTLGGIETTMKDLQIPSPSLCVVGDVVSCRESLQWVETTQGLSKRIWVCRPRSTTDWVEETALECGFDTIKVPVCEFEACSPPEDFTLETLKTVSDIVFTSPRAVEQFMRRCQALKVDSRQLTNHQIVSIGPSTTAALQNVGLFPDYESSTHSSKGLCDYFGTALGGRLIAFPAAKEAKEIVLKHCESHGATVYKWPLYQKVWCEEHLKAIRLEDGDLIILSSFEIAQQFIKVVEYDTHDVQFICFSQDIADLMESKGLKCKVLLRCDRDGLSILMDKLSLIR